MSNTVGEKTEFKYIIDTELTAGNLRFLPEFLKRNYFLQKEKYRDVRQISDKIQENRYTLNYRVLVPNSIYYVDIVVLAGVPIKVSMRPSDSKISKTFLNHLYEDIFLMVQLFEEDIRKTTLYLAFMLKERNIKKKEQRSIIGRIFTESMLSLFILLSTLTFVLFFIFGSLGPLIFVAFLFSLSILVGKIVAKSGDWKITKEEQEIILLQYHFSPETFEEFRKKYANIISEIKKKIYNNSIAKGKIPSCEVSSKIFSEYGIDCKTENLSIKKINIYEIVKKVADKFGLTLPTIVVKNTIIPNAAAAGATPRIGTILITTGIMHQLEEDELLSVIGHEMSHLKNHDPLVMSSLSSIEFLLRFYIFLPYINSIGLFGFWIYFIFAIGLIYFFGKFLEGRADLDSAKIIGQPKVMAEALRKIGFKRLFPLFKREPSFKEYRRKEWLRFDPHPPIYHRIAQLEKIKDPKKIEHTFLKTVKENIKGFLNP
jgi:heat shock protein HtpX